ncbi:MAG: carbon-nitrogen hydrolase family protein [Pirellulales bacterium]|nr:carbon-nitrogen hydrolase family protein [Pirellulales bacterium]
MYRPAKWDKDANQRALDAAIRKAQAAGAQLIVTPEGALEGYLVNDVRKETGQRRRDLTERFNRVAEPIDGPFIQHFQRLCRELEVFLVLGFLEAADGKTYNTAVVIDSEGKIVGKYRKTHFAQGYEVGEEKGNNPAGYTRGEDYPVFDVAGRKMGIMICYDRRVPKVAKRLAENGANFIVNPAYGMKGDCNRRFISARAKETGVPILLVHPNQTVFGTPDGEIRVDSRPKNGDQRTCFVAIE